MAVGITLKLEIFTNQYIDLSRGNQLLDL